MKYETICLITSQDFQKIKVKVKVELFDMNDAIVDCDVTHGNLWCNATTVNIYCIENKKQIDICMAHDVTH
jgi:hypothetical protein